MKEEVKPNEIKKLQEDLKNTSNDFLAKYCGLEPINEEKTYPKVSRKITENGKRVINSASFHLICKQEAKTLVSGIPANDPDFFIPLLAVKASKFFEFDGETLTPEQILTRFDSDFLVILSGAMI